MNVLIILVGIFSNQRATYWRYARYVYSFRLIHQFRDLFPVVIRLSSEVADTGIVGHRIFIDCCGYLIFINGYNLKCVQLL